MNRPFLPQKRPASIGLLATCFIAVASGPALAKASTPEVAVPPAGMLGLGVILGAFVVGAFAVLLALLQRRTTLQRVQALRDSEERFRQCVEYSPDGIFMADEMGRYVMANEAASGASGFTKAELLTRSIGDLVHPDDRQAGEDHFKRLLQHGTSAGEVHFQTKAGERRLWHVKAVRLGTDQLLGFTRDITEIRRAEADLQRRLRYEHLLSHISLMAVQEKDVAALQEKCVLMMGESLDVSRVYVFEHRHETDTIDNTFEWVAEGVSPQMENLQAVPSSAVPWWTEQVTNGRVICFEDIEQIPDESTRQILRAQGILSILVVPIFVAQRYFGFVGFDECRRHRNWPSEDVDLLLAMVRSISGALERNHAENALQVSDWAFRSAVNAIAICDLQGRLARVNPAFLELWGAANEQDAAPRAFASLWPFPELGQRMLASALEQGSWRGETTGLRTDGTTFPAEVSASVVRDNAGQPMAILGVFVDTTERKRAEEERERLRAQLIHAQKLESVGRLAGGVAHDFNNTLGVILGRAEMAMNRIDRKEPLFEDLQEIRKSARRSADLTRQLLAFARKQRAVPRALDLNDTVSGMLKMLLRLIGENIELHWQPATGVWPILIDPAQVDQILANLCVNARDAITGVGHIVIETGNVTLDETAATRKPDAKQGDFVRLTVRDDGCGMDDQVRAHIFEPFFTTKEIGQGTGLGLAMVYGIVQQNGGFIEVESAPGEGSRFHIHLPRHDGPILDANATELSAPPVDPGRYTILLVEDEEPLLNICQAILSRCGYRILAATSPGEALRQAEAHAGDIDLLLSDVVMPEMNGWDLSQRLQQQRPKLKRLFMSGYTADVLTLHGVGTESTTLLQKPFSTGELIAAAHNVLTRI